MNWDIVSFLGEADQANAANLSLCGGWMPGHTCEVVQKKQLILHMLPIDAPDNAA